jgi:beta-glucosidase
MFTARFSATTIIPLGFVLASGLACVPRAQKNNTGGGGTTAGTGGTGGTAAVAAVTTCPDADEDLGTDVVDAGAPAKMACTNVKQGCFPYVKPYTDDQVASDRQKAQQKMAGLTDSQKANQLRGTVTGQYNDIERTWHDKNDTAYSDTGGILELKFRDASRGLNFAVESIGSGYATAFPVSMARGASWDQDLEYRVGQAAGDEMVASGNTMLLAPCVNILRNPLWGRAQETYGEDSFALGRMGSAYTIGLQEYVASCAKHYAANNVEDDRQKANALMDEQTLREIYGRHFEMLARDAGISGVMASYNRVNNIYATEQKHLMTDILRGSAATGGFDFKGLVLSDWWAIQNHQDFGSPSKMLANNCMNAGLDIELGSNFNYSTLEGSLQDQSLSRDVFEAAVTRVMAQKVRFNGTDVNPPGGHVGLKASVSHYTGFNNNPGGHSIDNNDQTGHIALAQEVAIKSMVLLKNDNQTLPIKRSSVSKIAVLGRTINYGMIGGSGANEQNGGIVDFLRTVRTGDIGSSRVFIDFAKSSSPLQGITEAAGNAITVQGFDNAAAAKTFNPDFVVVVVGLTPLDEGEQYTMAGDRTTFDLDAKTSGGQIQLINDAIAMNKPMVLVLEGGSVITIPSLAQLKAVVMAWYPGMDGGRALGKLLFGDANFSGKLPISWAKQVSDLPPFKDNAEGDVMMDYYLGYRYFDKIQKDNPGTAATPQFKFGHGLSYTSFTYANLQLPCSTVDENSTIDVTVDVTNSGSVAGDEVVFLFAGWPNTKARRSIKELKGFRKVHIEPGHTKRVHIPLRITDLKYFQTDAGTNATTGKFVVEKDVVKIMVGGSSDETTLLSDTFTVN